MLPIEKRTIICKYMIFIPVSFYFLLQWFRNDWFYSPRSNSSDSIQSSQKKGKIAITDVHNLKEFQIDKRIFWGPKFIALANSIPEDMTISKMELSKKAFKMTLLARFDSLNPKTAYDRGMDLKTQLENTAFVDNFKDNTTSGLVREHNNEINLIEIINGSIQKGTFLPISM